MANASPLVLTRAEPWHNRVERFLAFAVRLRRRTDCERTGASAIDRVGAADSSGRHGSSRRPLFDLPGLLAADGIAGSVVAGLATGVWLGIRQMTRA